MLCFCRETEIAALQKMSQLTTAALQKGSRRRGDLLSFDSEKKACSRQAARLMLVAVARAGSQGDAASREGEEDGGRQGWLEPPGDAMMSYTNMWDLSSPTLDNVSLSGKLTYPGSIYAKEQSSVASMTSADNLLSKPLINGEQQEEEHHYNGNHNTSSMGDLIGDNVFLENYATDPIVSCHHSSLVLVFRVLQM
ncbi:hypothetical protein BHM03_00031513 [Ensete ventricosum]|nr:hypothetical protein BHM03_00031513 [Ensete ventricosum]